MTNKFCPSPARWLDMTIKFHRWDAVGFAICSQCWATHECILGEFSLQDIAEISFHDRFMELWNAERIRQIRGTWADGQVPRMCQSCPRLLADSDPPLKESEIDDPYLRTLIDTKSTITVPRVLSLGYDPSCNLACPSCRKEHFRLVPGDERYDLLQRFQRQFVMRLLQDATDAHCTGYGDPFGSQLYWELLTTITPADAPRLKWYFLTNGLGFTEKAYAQIPTREQIAGVNVSVDAATDATYRENRGGSWNKLLSNLEFLADLRRGDAIDKFELGFVYQANNWREIPAFVELAEHLGATRIILYTLLDHTGGDEHRAKCVYLAEHPDHDEAMEMVRWAREEGGIPCHVEMPNEERAGVTK